MARPKVAGSVTGVAQRRRPLEGMAAKGTGGGVGTLKSTSINGVKLYSVTGKNYVVPWVLAKKKRSLRKDAEYQRRLELIHDLRFETATTRIKVTPDGQYVIASGIYPPQMKDFELKELLMKFERHMKVLPCHEGCWVTSPGPICSLKTTRRLKCSTGISRP